MLENILNMYRLVDVYTWKIENTCVETRYWSYNNKCTCDHAT